MDLELKRLLRPEPAVSNPVKGPPMPNQSEEDIRRKGRIIKTEFDIQQEDEIAVLRNQLEKMQNDVSGNRYSNKKTIAQGLLDFAFLTANASQLKNLFETENHPNYHLCMTLLGISIALQIIVGVLLLVTARIRETDVFPVKRSAVSIPINDVTVDIPSTDTAVDKKTKSTPPETEPCFCAGQYNCIGAKGAENILTDISTACIFFITIANIFTATFISHGKAYLVPINVAIAGNNQSY